MVQASFTERTNQGKWDGKDVDLSKPQYLMEALKMSASYGAVRMARSAKMELPPMKAMVNVGVANFLYEWAIEATEKGGNRFWNFPKLQDFVKVEDETVTEAEFMVTKWLYVLLMKFVLSQVTPGQGQKLGSDAYNIALAIILRHGVGYFASSDAGDVNIASESLNPPTGFTGGGEQGSDIARQRIANKARDYGADSLTDAENRIMGWTRD